MNQPATEASRRYIRQFFIPGTLAALVPLLISCFSLYSGTSLWDDAFMFLRYGEHFLGGHGISWNPDGMPTYGLTSLAYFFWSLAFTVIFEDPARGLWFASATAGVLFCLLLMGVILRYCGAEGWVERWLVVLFTATTLGAAAPELAAHFASGMDTTLAMLWVTLCLSVILWERRTESLFAAALSGALVGFTFYVRPDALILLALPLVLLQPTFRHAVTSAGAAAAAIALQLAWGKSYFGTWLPYPFYVKSGTLYDPAFYDFFKGATLHYFLLFMSSLPWAVLAIVGQAIVSPRSFSRTQFALSLACVVFWIYQLAFVTPIMGEHARFLFPSLPLVCCIAGVSILELAREGGKKFNFASAFAQVRVPGLFVLCVLAAVSLKFDYVREAFSTSLHGRKVVWGLGDIYRERYRKSWAALDEVSRLPNDLVIAATEVGLLGAMNSDKRIIDLTGLHDAEYLNGFDAAALWGREPGLIYLPFPHYVAMTNAIVKDQRFEEEYRHFDAEALDSRFGAAVRKSGKYSDELNRIFSAW